MHGKVKWFSIEKGYGFITDDSAVDHYFHVKDVVGAALPKGGERVSFEAGSGKKGPRASSVTLLEASEGPVGRQHADDRITCPACNKRIVPRMITYRGEPQKSVCPYCAATVAKFGSNILGYVLFAVIALILLAAFI